MEIKVIAADRHYGRALCSALADSFRYAKIIYEYSGAPAVQSRVEVCGAPERAAESDVRSDSRNAQTTSDEAGADEVFKCFEADPLRPFSELRNSISEYISDSGYEPSAVFSADMSGCKIVCFTAACGGVGLSSCARMFADVQTLIYGKKTLYISLDRFYPGGLETVPGPVFRFMFDLASCSGSAEKTADPSLPLSFPDSCGAYSLELSEVNCLADSSAKELYALFAHIAGKTDFQLICVDMPRESCCFDSLPGMCEKLVHILARDGLPADKDSAMERHLKKKYKDRYYAFRPSECADFEADVHSSLGKEIRELAERMELQ